MSIQISTDTYKYTCGHTVVRDHILYAVQHRIFNEAMPCYDCRQKLIGKRVELVRYGNIPSTGKSYNYRDNKYECGVSCYFQTQKPRSEFVEGRNKVVISAVIVGYGGDDEPCVAAKTIKILNKN